MNPESETVDDTQYLDLSDVTPVNHRYDHITGNELHCTLHGGLCPVIFVKPTQVLEKGADGTLQLVDKDPSN